MKTDNLPQALIMALADDKKREKLQAIVTELQRIEKYDTFKFQDNNPLEIVTYGIGGVPFSRIAKLLDKE